MRLFTFCLLIVLFAARPATGQTVINTEALRLEADTQRVQGSLALNLGMSRNKAGRFFRPGIDGRLELRTGQNRFMVLGGYALTRFTDIDEPGAPVTIFNERGFGHLRFNRTLSGRVTWEAFGQYQFDQVQEIDRRILIGTGPRLRITETESGFLFGGLQYMYEYEETSAVEGDIVYNKHNRLSAYISGGSTFNEHVSGNLTVYYQPRPDRWSDYRVSATGNLTAKLTGGFGFSLNVNYVYDARPPVSVPTVMYDFGAGLTFNW
jgi:hypothetical protein